MGRNDLIWNGDVICRKGSIRPLITIERDPGVASVNLKPRQRAANNDAGCSMTSTKRPRAKPGPGNCQVCRSEHLHAINLAITFRHFGMD